MGTGFSGVRKVVENNKRARENASNNTGSYVKKFKIQDGQTVVVRFLGHGEDMVKWCYIHAIPTGGSWPEDFPCLDQDGEGRRCPGCESSNEKIAKKKFKGFVNMIWREAPKQEKQANGKWATTGYQDAVVVWMSGITVFDELDTLDVNYKGLASRDFKVNRKGEKLDTTYKIFPADVDGGPQPLSEADQELAKNSYDLQQFITPLSYEEMLDKVNGNASASSGGNTSPNTTSSPFSGRGGAPDPAGNIFAG